jgi:hypothetical protein
MTSIVKDHPIWTPSDHDIELIRKSWLTGENEFDFLYDLGYEIYEFIFETAPQVTMDGWDSVPI